MQEEGSIIVQCMMMWFTLPFSHHYYRLCLSVIYIWLLIEAVCIADDIAQEHNLITKFSKALLLPHANCCSITLFNINFE